MKNRKNRRWVLIALIALTAGACSTSTKADTVGLRYGDGPLEGHHFEKVVEPGSGAMYLVNDHLINIETGKREYTFCVSGCDGPPITATALGGAELAFSGGVTFKVATGDEAILREFYEEVCRKFDCAGRDGFTNGGEGEGWDKLLQVNVRGPIEDSIQEEIRGYSVDAIYAGIPAEGEGVSEEEALSTLTKVSDALEASLRSTINAYAGGEYFCGPSYERDTDKKVKDGKNDDCPEFEFLITEVTPSQAIKDAFDRNVASRQAVIDARNNAEALVAEATGKKDAQQALEGLYTDAGWIEYLYAQAVLACAQNSNCTLIVGGDETGVNVTPKSN